MKQIKENILKMTGAIAMPLYCGLLFAGCVKTTHPPVPINYDATDTVTYLTSDEDFPNPERGYYTPTEAFASNYKPLDVTTLINARTVPQQAWRGNYKIYSTLFFRYFILEGFNNKLLTTDILNKIKADFDVVRQAGVKLIPRFTYTNTKTTGSCPGGFFCPPYGDAPKAIVLQHIEQLKPILQANADVIASVQLGFIGIWGENYYTDYFGDASQNGQGKLLDENWRDRSEVLKALLDALPKDRMVQVRLPQMKQRFVYGVNAPINSQPLTEAEAFSGSDKARVGLHNDCFISNATDFGTFENYGNSSSAAGGGRAELRAYAEADNKYTVVGGETCSETYSPQNNCENAGIVQTELMNMHYSYLNSSYNKIGDIWISGGCMENIKKNLGYRLVLLNTIVPKARSKADMKLPLEISLRNDGYASPFNPRTAKLVMRNADGGKEFVYDLSTNVQKWFSGNIKISETIQMNSGMPVGKYDLYLYLPDKYESIGKRPEYAIRFANKDLWDATTGYNNLKISVTIQ